MSNTNIEGIENRKLLLGIDPSFSNFGACIYDPATKEMILNTSSFNDGLKWIGNNCKLDNVIAYVENPNLDSPIFKMWYIVKLEIEAMNKYNKWLMTGRNGSLPRKVTINDVQSKFSIGMKYASSVGENRANAKQIIKMLAERNVPVIEIAPSKRIRADKARKKAGSAGLDVKFLTMPTKTNKTEFFELTGHQGRTSEHARDAATLVFGRSLTQAKMQAKGQWQRNKNKPASFPSQTNDNLFLISAEEQVGIIDQKPFVKP